MLSSPSLLTRLYIVFVSKDTWTYDTLAKYSGFFLFIFLLTGGYLLLLLAVTVTITGNYCYWRLLLLLLAVNVN